MLYKPLYTLSLALAFITGRALPSVAQTANDVWIANGFGLFFISVVAGILLAFAFQFLLTNLAVASGISAIGDIRDKGETSGSQDSDADQAENTRGTPTGVMISSGIGIYLVITMSVSLFFASLIAVSLSPVLTNFVGFALGLVIWAGYLLLALYADSKMISSLTGTVFSSVKSVLNAGSSAMGEVFGSSRKSQIADTARESVKAIQDEIRQEYDITHIQDKLDEYLGRLEPQNDAGNLKEQMAELLHNIEVKEKYTPDDPEAVKSLFLEVAGKRPNISEKEKKQLTDAFDQAKEIYQSKGSGMDKVLSAVDHFSPGDEEQGRKYRENVEHYLRETNVAELQPDNLKEDLDHILNNPKAAPDVVQARASKIDRSALKSMLTTKEGMTDEKAEQYLDKADEFLNYIKSKANETQERSKSQAGGMPEGGRGDGEGHSSGEQKIRAEQTIKEWFDRMDQPELEYNKFKQAAKRIMDDPKTAPAVLKKQLSHMDRDSLISLISNNRQISREQAERYAEKIEEARDEVLSKTDEIERQVREKTQQVKNETLWQVEAARKTAAAAAWWMFLAAIVSGGASALGGILAISLFFQL
ncbi:MAG: hypothetical protein WD266_01350 [Balneolales bacterium]